DLHTRLASQPGDLSGIDGGGRAQHFDRNRRAEPYVLSGVDRADAAGANLAHDSVLPTEQAPGQLARRLAELSPNFQATLQSGNAISLENPGHMLIGYASRQQPYGAAKPGAYRERNGGGNPAAGSSHGAPTDHGTRNRAPDGALRARHRPAHQVTTHCFAVGDTLRGQDGGLWQPPNARNGSQLGHARLTQAAVALVGLHFEA